MLLHIFFLILGLLLLVKGAEGLVEGASALARKYRVSELAIGLTIVAFGTSAPELVVNAVASFQGKEAIILGNVIGSNNVNLFVILGISGLITPLVVQSSTVWKEIPLSLLAALLVYFLVHISIGPGVPSLLSGLEGLTLLTLFVLFLWYVFRSLKKDLSPSSPGTSLLPMWKMWTYLVLGLAGLLLGGKWVVDHAISIAVLLGVSESIIGLTLVAMGTSLPELATSVTAAMKKNNDIAIGNIIGSNIFNLLFILAVSVLIRPVSYTEQFTPPLLLLVGGTLFLFVAMFTGKQQRLDRAEAALLLLAYILFSWWFIF